MAEKEIITCHDRTQAKTVEVPVEKLTWRPSVYGLLIQDDKILLSPQWDGWDFPGGGIDKGEGVKEALVREFKEETRLDVEVGEFVDQTEDYFIPDFVPDTYWHGLLLYFTVKNPKGEISDEGFAMYEKKYMRKAEWVSLEEVLTLKFYNPADLSCAHP